MNDKYILSKKIDQQIKDYISKGGIIKKCEPGESAYDLTKKHSLKNVNFNTITKYEDVIEMKAFRRHH